MPRGTYNIRIITVLLTLFGPCLASHGIALSDLLPAPIAYQYWRNTVPMDFTAITWADDKFVVVGKDIPVLVSTNGIDWHNESWRSVPFEDTTALSYAHGLYVAGNPSGFDRPNATTNLTDFWLEQNSISSGSSGRSAQSLFWFSGNYFLNHRGNVGSSTNGLLWLGKEGIGGVQGLASDGHQMIGFGFYHSLHRRSQDDAGWRSETYPDPRWDQIVTIDYLGGRWLAQGTNGTIISSQDGVAWNYTQLQPPGDASISTRPVFLQGAWFVRSGTNYFRSEDLMAWDLLPTRPPSQVRQYASNGKVVVGVGTAGAIYYTTNFLDWIPTQPGRPLPLTTVRHAGGVTLALTASAAHLRSTDGVNWVSNSLPAEATMRSLAYGSGRYVLVGERGTVLVSTNAWDWEAVESTTRTNLSQVVHEAGRFVAVGGAGTVIVSADGKVWKRIVVDPPVDLLGIGAFHGELLAIGSQQRLFRSTNAYSWEVQTLPGTNQPKSIVVADPGLGRVVLDTGKSVLTSADARSWKERVVAANDSGELAYGNGLLFRQIAFPAVGYSYDGEFYLSFLLTRTKPASVCFGHGTFMVVGAGGQIVQTALVLQVLGDSAKPGILTLHGRIGDRYRIEFSDIGPKPFAWQPETDVLMTENPQAVPVRPVTGPRARYYRAVFDGAQ